MAQRLHIRIVSNPLEHIIMKLGLKIPQTSKRTQYFKYYKCDRCGYISTQRNTECPICKKDGLSNKLR